MADTAGIVRLEDLVDGYIWTANLPKEEYRRLFDIAVKCVTDLNIIHSKGGKSIAKITMDSNYVADFPDDFQSFVAVGVPMDNKYWFFTKDEGILDPEVRDVDYTEDDEFIGYVNGYGAKGGINTEGYYKLDYKNRRILFRNTKRNDVILVYTTSGVSITEDTYIPVTYRFLLEKQIAFESNALRLDIPASRISMYKEMYDTEVNKLNMLQGDTIDEWYDTAYKLMSQSPIR